MELYHCLETRDWLPVQGQHPPPKAPQGCYQPVDRRSDEAFSATFNELHKERPVDKAICRLERFLTGLLILGAGLMIYFMWVMPIGWFILVLVSNYVVGSAVYHAVMCEIHGPRDKEES